VNTARITVSHQRCCQNETDTDTTDEKELCSRLHYLFFPCILPVSWAYFGAELVFCDAAGKSVFTVGCTLIPSVPCPQIEIHLYNKLESLASSLFKATLADKYCKPAVQPKHKCVWQLSYRRLGSCLTAALILHPNAGTEDQKLEKEMKEGNIGSKIWNREINTSFQKYFIRKSGASVTVCF